MSRVTEATTDVGSEGNFFIKHLLRALGMLFAVSACNTAQPPPPEMFLMQPKVYLP